MAEDLSSDILLRIIREKSDFAPRALSNIIKCCRKNVVALFNAEVIEKLFAVKKKCIRNDLFCRCGLLEALSCLVYVAKYAPSDHAIFSEDVCAQVQEWVSDETPEQNMYFNMILDPSKW